MKSIFDAYTIGFDQSNKENPGKHNKIKFPIDNRTFCQKHFKKITSKP